MGRARLGRRGRAGQGRARRRRGKPGPGHLKRRLCKNKAIAPPLPRTGFLGEISLQIPVPLPQSFKVIVWPGTCRLGDWVSTAASRGCLGIFFSSVVWGNLPWVWSFGRGGAWMFCGSHCKEVVRGWQLGSPFPFVFALSLQCLEVEGPRRGPGTMAG